MTCPVENLPAPLAVEQYEMLQDYIRDNFDTYEDFNAYINSIVNGSASLDSEMKGIIQEYMELSRLDYLGQDRQEALEDILRDAFYTGSGISLQNLGLNGPPVGTGPAADAAEAALKAARGMALAGIIVSVTAAIKRSAESPNPLEELSAESISLGSGLAAGIGAQTAMSLILTLGAGAAFAGTLPAMLVAGAVGIGVGALTSAFMKDKWDNVLADALDKRANNVPEEDILQDALNEILEDAQDFFNDPPPPEAYGSPNPFDPCPSNVNPPPAPFIPEAFGPFIESLTQSSPLILDLDGDGIELTAFDPDDTTTFFDIDGDAFAEQTAWIAANQDGLLVRDLNDDGLITDVEELFGSPSVDGFALLATLDDNGDNRVDQYDDAWSDLLVWKDFNGDGVTQDGELLTLASLNIISIDLAGVTASTSTINGNSISHTSSYTLANGTTRSIVDVWFTHDNVNSHYIGDYTLDSRTLFLPSLRGYGELPDLYIAMSMDQALLEMVEDFTTGFSFEAFDPNSGIDGVVSNILYRWAGVDGVNPTNRGGHIDARQLGFLEQFFGKNYAGLYGNPNPQASAANLLEESFRIVFENIKAHLLLQVGAAKLFAESVFYNPYTGEPEGNAELSQAAIIDLEDFATDVGVDPEAYWIEVAKFIDATKGFANLTSTENGWLNTSIVASDPGLTWTAIKALTNPDNEGSTISGTSGADTLNGTALNETINGQDGNDTVSGLAGNDTLNGGSGDDTLYGGTGNDYLIGGSNNDTLDGGAGGDTVEGGNGNDTYIYTSGDDVYYDTSGTNTVTLPVGITLSDVAVYRLDDDAQGIRSLFITVDALGLIEFKEVVGTNGFINNYFQSIVFADTSTLNLQNQTSLTTYGGTGNDTIHGAYGTSAIAETMYGLGGNDQLRGEDGNDTLDGGIGNDDLRGGAGNDTYIASAGFDNINSENGGTDIVVLPTWVTIGDVHLIRLNSLPNDLQMNIDGLGQIVIDNQFFQVGYRVETLQFASSSLDLTTQSIETVGGTGDDTMNGISSGASVNDIFDGREGNDTMSGGSGNDVYYFSMGQDAINESNGSPNDGVKFREGYTGNDINIYRGGYQGKDLIFADANGNTLNVLNHFNNSNLMVEYAQFYDTTTWTFSTMEIETRGTSGIDQFLSYDIGDASNADTIFGYAGNDDLRGGNGNDVIDGGGDNDYMDGEAGSDSVSYASAASGTTVNLVTVTAQNTGGAGIDTILNFENLIGSAYNDTLTGDSNANIIEGGSGNDTLNGAGGTDTLSYQSAGSGITINLATATGQNTGGAGTDTISNFENLRGSTYNDTLTGTSGNNVIEGGAGNDTINGQGGIDTLTYANAAGAVTVSLAVATAQNTSGAGTDTISNMENLTGSANGDTLTGSTAANTIDGGNGDDTIEGGAGNDTLTGGSGTDTVSYVNAGSAVTVNLATATGQNTAGAGTDTISGFENLRGSAFNDTLTGNNSDNVIEGGAGNDTINGSGGTDTLSYANAGSGVTVNLSTATGQNTGGAGTDTISNMENLTGSAHNDTLTGTSNANTIRGGSGADTISAGGGADFLYGGAGADTLTGSTGGDAFIFEAATALGASDTITDFSTAQVDKLDVSDILSAYDPLSHAISDFIRITDNGTHSLLSVDADGGGNSFTQIAQLSSVTNLAAGATATEIELQAMITAGTLVV